MNERRGRTIAKERHGRRPIAREQAVLDAAMQLLVVNPRASMQDVAAAAGISRTTLHRLYPSRDALIEAIALVAVEEITAAFAAARLEEDSAVEALRRLVEALVPLVYQFAFLVSETQIQESEGVRQRDRELQEETERLFRRGQAEGAFRFDLPAAWLAYALSGLFLGAVEGVRQGNVAPRETTRLILETFLAGVATGPRRHVISSPTLTSERSTM
jgi:TetR/AcrR family transcriptional repressor of mexCD-oprJ operon